MRVLYICHIANRYGANRSLFELATELNNLGVEPAFVIPKEDSFQADLESKNFPFKVAPVSWWVEPVPALIRYHSEAELHSLPVDGTLIEFANSFGPDLIHTNSVVTPDGYLLSKTLGVPHLWHIREMCEEHYKFRFTTGKDAVLNSLNETNLVVANSNACLAAYFKDVNSKKHHVVYNPVRVPASLPPKTVRTDQLRLATLGHMTEAKCHHEAIVAVKELLTNGTEAHLSIVGGGENSYKQYCKKLARELKVEKHVEFISHIESPFELYANTDIFLQCSEHEAFGRVTVEAMLSECPVIGKRSGGTSEIINDGETGFLYDVGAELYSRIQEVIRDPSLVAITSKAKAFALSEFAPEKIAKDTLALYYSVLKRSTTSRQTF